MKTTLVALAAGVTLACGPGSSSSPPPSAAPPASTPVTTTPTPCPSPSLPPTCTQDSEQEEREAEMKGTSCFVSAPAKEDCDRVKAGKPFKWKFTNNCSASVYQLTIVDPTGKDLSHCDVAGEVKPGKKADIRCDVAPGCWHTLRYHVVWKKDPGDSAPQVHDPILDIRRGP